MSTWPRAWLDRHLRIRKRHEGPLVPPRWTETVAMFALCTVVICTTYFGLVPHNTQLLRSGHPFLCPTTALDGMLPFVPQFIWAYLSMYVLFVLPLLFIPAANMPALGRQLIAGCVISAAIFLLLPAELGFMRQVPRSHAAIYAGMFNIDRPYNLVPSLHVIWSTAIVMACADFARPAMRVALLAWLCVIVASTVLVHQHHLLDVIAALAIVFFLRRQYEVLHA